MEAFIAQNGTSLPLAKSNGDSFYLADPSEVAIAAETEVNLTIIVDGDVDSRPIILTEGIQPGQSEVPYRDPAMGA